MIRRVIRKVLVAAVRTGIRDAICRRIGHEWRLDVPEKAAPGEPAPVVRCQRCGVLPYSNEVFLRGAKPPPPRSTT